ncbi:MAG: hypothetical protein M1831_001653 [Alyxoria varia]|nr:MAG: hypothetical protein M1831_001653 [Alyxoria varia]
MFTSLFRRRPRCYHRSTALSGSFAQSHGIDPRHYEDDDVEDGTYEDVEDSADMEEAPAEDEPLLPLFSAAHLDSLPVYAVTHAVRNLIVDRCDTTLSWEQLRSPQISQFLVKPIQTQILSAHFSRAILYALIANCLQFKKEGEANPGIVGICQTRALTSELLAMRLLKEYSSRELIDALSYDFNPLSGVVDVPTCNINQHIRSHSGTSDKPYIGLSRTSTLEVAIRAQAKRFIAHPLVVQHLEAIWKGTVVFHSASDNLHRYPSKPPPSHERHYGAMHSHHQEQEYHGDETPRNKPQAAPIRRAVTLYDPSTASFFKLSRLRVPRYRQILLTLSYGIMLVLFLGVLSGRHTHSVTSIELMFWFWSAGFMLDELIGFSEQGFGLYIASVWNALDLGILMLFFTYFFIRFYGLLVYGGTYQQQIAEMAYDVLASSAVLLFPRLFSMLDHFKYFSQLLVAFRLMAQDLAAVLILITITCSGFFFCFWLSFGQDDFNGRGVAFALFQIFMGFSPAAWDVWNDFNVLGKILMALFLIICHFLVVTILVTVLTNSMANVIKNANEEHQFLFAINTISLVKSDALFSYLAPSNILGMIITPLRFLLPFRQFVLVNRTVIKVTHFPVLLIICAFEKLQASSATPGLEYVDQPGQGPQDLPGSSSNQGVFATVKRLRLPSEANLRKDRALNEVFRQSAQEGTPSVKPSRTRPITGRRVSAVDDWMNRVGNEGASPPQEETRSLLETLENGHPKGYGTYATRQASALGRPFTRSTLTSGNYTNNTGARRARLRRSEDSDLMRFSLDEGRDGAVEDSATTAEEEGPSMMNSGSDKENRPMEIHEHNITPRQPSFNSPTQRSQHNVLQPMATGASPTSITKPLPSFNKRSAKGHTRESSTGTIIFRPEPTPAKSPTPSPRSSPPRQARKPSRPPTAIPSPSGGNQQVKPTPSGKPRRFRPIMPPRNSNLNRSAPNLAHMLSSNAVPTNRPGRGSSFDAVALDLASDIGDNRFNEIHSPDVFGGAESASFIGGHGSGFHSRMEEAVQQRARAAAAEETNAMGRLVLARINNMEMKFGEMLRVMKELKGV